MSDSDIAQFCELTGADNSVAAQFLSGSDLESAITNYFATQEAAAPAPVADAFGTPPAGESDDEDDEEMPLAPAQSGGGGGYTLSGQPIAATGGDGFGFGSGSSTPRVGRVGQWGGGGPSARTAAGGSGPRIATLGGMNQQGPDSDSEDDEEERKKNPDLYAGGEKSGLAIQNPDKDKPKGTGRSEVDQILEQAQKGGTAPAPGQPKPKPSAFSGGGMTLGSDDVPSQPTGLPAGPSRPQGAGGAPGLLGGLFGGLAGMAGYGGRPGQQAPEELEKEEVQIRHLTFWREGFSVEDGPLMRYDAPGNKEILQAIQNGHAPPSILNVKIGQPVELRVARRLTEDFVQAPPKPKGPWEGTGNRLGSPAPGPGASTSQAAAPAPPQAEGSEERARAAFKVDLEKPVTSVQVRLADGTKIVVKVNLDHTIGDIRNLVNAAAPGGRPFTLQTTFPTKVLDDNSETIEAAKLQNAVVVQRWV